ncbi:MAG TPA: TonB-dependent receptor plug domain-containing protein [Labilithrix sp.]
MRRVAFFFATATATVLACSTRARADDAQEVVVYGGKDFAPGRAKSDELGREEVRRMPGAFGDPWRAIEIQPGFTPVLSGIPYFYVRGAPPGDVGYYFDGVRVPYLFHFGLGPAVVQPSLIARTDVHKGGYPASIGRWAGGVVDATAMPPQEDRAHGDGVLRAIDAGGLVETPFANGRGSALVGGRYSYTAALFSLLAQDTTLDYRDYQGRVAYALGDHDTVSLLVFGAYDNATQKETVTAEQLAEQAGSNDPSKFTPGKIERVLFSSEFHRVDGRWDHGFASGGQTRVAATVGFDRTRVEARRDGDDLMTGLRASLEKPLGKNVLLRTGADITIDQYGGTPLPRFADDDAIVARQKEIFAERTDYAAGAYIDAVFRPLPFFQVTPGVRADVFGSGSAQALAVDPRLAGRIDVTKKVRIYHSYGVASQPPSTPILLPGITIAHLDGGLQRAIQTSAGVEADLPEDITASATVFHNAFYSLNDALGTAQVELIDIEKSDSLLQKSRGSAYGLELGARRKLSRKLTGIVAYTLSRSIRTANGKDFVSGYDRTHVGSIVLSYDLGRMWRAGARYVFYSGIPQTPNVSAFPEQLIGQPPQRTPPFQRIDLRVEKRWNVGQRGWVSVVAEALNATLSSEVTGYSCSTSLKIPNTTATAICNARIVGPISVPSIGVEGGF